MTATETEAPHPGADSARRLLTPKEAAAYLGTTEKALENWRGAGNGPAYVKLSARCIRYAQEDLDAHVWSSRRRNTAEPG